MTKSLTDLKAGDIVFIVQQKKRGEPEFRTSFETIVRVGRKYAYIERYGFKEPFCRKTGVSVHDRDSNARSNHYGFDVYLCKEDWLKEQHDVIEKRRLEKRILKDFGKLTDLRPETVQKIHEVLDGDGVK